MSDPHPIQTAAAAGAPEFVTLDAQDLLDRALENYEAETGRRIQPSQVETYVLKTIAYMFTVFAAETQNGLEQNLLAYASEGRLDAIGADRNTPRLAAAAATVRAVFRGSAPFATNRVIPTGTRIEVGGVTFAVDFAAVGIAGNTSVEADLTAVIPGPLPVALIAGARASLIDPIPDITTVELSGAATSGAARETDEPYRLRLALAWEKINRGGTRKGYTAMTRDWSARVLDVFSERPEPGHARIVPLMSSGPVSPEDRTSLLAYMAEDRTPQGDYIRIDSPVADTFGVALSLVIDRGEALPAAEVAVAALLDEWRRTLGGQVLPSDIIARARSVPGVLDADTPGLLYRAVAPDAYRDASLDGPATVQVVE